MGAQMLVSAGAAATTAPGASVASRALTAAASQNARWHEPVTQRATPAVPLAAASPAAARASSAGSMRAASSSSATWRTPRAPTRPCHRLNTASCPSRPTRSPCLFYPLYAVSRSLLDGRRCNLPIPLAPSLSGVWLPRRMMKYRERTGCQKQTAGTLFAVGTSLNCQQVLERALTADVSTHAPYR